MPTLKLSSTIILDIKVSDSQLGLNIEVDNIKPFLNDRDIYAALHLAAAALIDGAASSCFAYVVAGRQIIKLELAEHETIAGLAQRAVVALERAGFVARFHG